MPNNNFAMSFVLMTAMVVYSCLLLGCGANGSTREWISITTNGDKPGIGIVLLETAGLVNAGSFYILDPSRQNLLASGKRYDLINVTQNGKTITCGVEVDDLSAPTGKRKIEMVIAVQKQFETKQIEATVNADGHGPRNTVFKLSIGK